MAAVAPRWSGADQPRPLHHPLRHRRDAPLNNLAVLRHVALVGHAPHQHAVVADPDRQPRVSGRADREGWRPALAYLLERRIEAGEVRGFVDAAERLGLTRARLSQIMDHLLLPLVEQERLLLRGTNA